MPLSGKLRMAQCARAADETIDPLPTGRAAVGKNQKSAMLVEESVQFALGKKNISAMIGLRPNSCQRMKTRKEFVAPERHLWSESDMNAAIALWRFAEP